MTLLLEPQPSSPSDNTRGSYTCDVLLTADLSHLSDDEFLAGEGGAGGAGAGDGLRVGELPGSAAARDKGLLMLRMVSAALKKPGMTQRFGQVLPILRVMSPPQRLALVSLVMQQAMVPKDLPEPALEVRPSSSSGAACELSTGDW